MREWFKKKWTQFKSRVKSWLGFAPSRNSSSNSLVETAVDVAEIAVDLTAKTSRGAGRAVGGQFNGGGATGTWAAESVSTKAATVATIADASPAFAEAAAPTAEAASSGIGELASSIGEGIGNAASATGEFLSNAAEVAGGAAEAVGSGVGAVIGAIGEIASGL